MAHPKQPVDYRFILYRGMPWDQKFGYESETGQKVDMTGWVGRCDVRKTVDSADVAFSFSTEDGSMVLTDGEVELKLPDPTDVPEDYAEGVGHVVVGPTPETAAPIAYFAFLINPVTTQVAP